MGICYDCTFAELDDPRNEHTPMRYVCTNPKLCEPSEADYNANDQLIYAYDEGGRFYTGPLFGCVHFNCRDMYGEAKEEETK